MILIISPGITLGGVACIVPGVVLAYIVAPETITGKFPSALTLPYVNTLVSDPSPAASRTQMPNLLMQVTSALASTNSQRSSTDDK